MKFGEKVLSKQNCYKNWAGTLGLGLIILKIKNFAEMESGFHF